jgi:hypothetical protein
MVLLLKGLIPGLAITLPAGRPLLSSWGDYMHVPEGKSKVTSIYLIWVTNNFEKLKFDNFY